MVAQGVLLAVSPFLRGRRLVSEQEQERSLDDVVEGERERERE